MRRPRHGQRRDGRSGSLILAGILILAVASGYVGTKYVFAPYILEGKVGIFQNLAQGNNRESDIQDTVSGPGIVSGQQDVQQLPTGAAVLVTQAAVSTPTSVVIPETVLAPTSDNVGTGTQQTGGYAVQFGSFSTKGAGEQAVSDLKEKGIAASVIEKNGAFKVVGAPFDTKEKAAAEAEKLRPLTEDVYVVEM